MMSMILLHHVMLLHAVQVAQEMAAAVPANATTWGWKHPYALFTLNQIYQVQRNVLETVMFCSSSWQTHMRFLLSTLAIAWYHALRAHL